MAGSRDPQEHIPIPDLSIPENRHEHRDVNVWAVYKFGIALSVLCIVAVGLLYGLYRYFLNREGGALPYDQVNVDARSLPPMPRLQAAPIADMKDMRAAEERIISGYGWVDQKQGVTRIPVDRAIDLLAQRGIAGRTATPPPPGSDVSIPKESGLGPKVHRPGGPLGSGDAHAAVGHSPAAEHAPAAGGTSPAAPNAPAGAQPATPHKAAGEHK
jgi:hypothetical protein